MRKIGTLETMYNWWADQAGLPPNEYQSPIKFRSENVRSSHYSQPVFEAPACLAYFGNRLGLGILRNCGAKRRPNLLG